MTDDAELPAGALGGLVALIVAADSYRVAAASHYGLSVTDTHAISYLDTLGPMPQSRLARLLGVTSGAVTGIVDRLERSGTARRHLDPYDRRRHRVELTERSREILADSRVGLHEALALLDPDALDTLSDTLPQLAKALTQEAGQIGERSAFPRAARCAPRPDDERTSAPVPYERSS